MVKWPHSLEDDRPVWSTKYCYPVLRGDVQIKCRALLIQVAMLSVNILKVAASKDHVHMYIGYRPFQDISSLVKKLKGRI